MAFDETAPVKAGVGIAPGDDAHPGHHSKNLDWFSLGDGDLPVGEFAQISAPSSDGIAPGPNLAALLDSHAPSKAAADAAASDETSSIVNETPVPADNSHSGNVVPDSAIETIPVVESRYVGEDFANREENTSASWEAFHRTSGFQFEKISGESPLEVHLMPRETSADAGFAPRVSFDFGADIAVIKTAANLNDYFAVNPAASKTNASTVTASQTPADTTPAASTIAQAASDLLDSALNGFMAATSTSSSTFPYNTIVLIESTFAAIPGQFIHGTGVIIGPHTILTASHLLWDADYNALATSVSIIPAYNSSGIPNPGDGNPIAGTEHLHYFQVGNSDGTINASDSQNDIAIIDVDTTFTSWMGIQAGYTGGTVHVTGYPGTSGFQDDETGTVTQDSTYNLLDYNSLPVSKGNSGGPLWYNYTSSDPVIVGIVSTVGWANQITNAEFTQIQNWQTADGVTPITNTNGSPPGGGTGTNDVSVVINSVNTNAGIGSPSTTTTPGGSIFIDATIYNTFNTVQGPHWIPYLSTDSTITTSDTVLGTYSQFFDGVPANGSADATYSGYLPTNLAPGTYYIGFILDALPGDTNRSDDFSAGIPITVTGSVPSNGVDLQVTGLSLSSTTWHVGDTITATYTVKNAGAQSTTADFLNYLFVSTDSTVTIQDTGVSVGDLTSTGVKTIAAGASSAGTLSFTVSNLAVGTYYVGLLADGQNVISETNENNNWSQTYQITVAAAPNHAPVLTATSANVSANAGTVLSASSLFSATDQDGDSLTYYLYDTTPAANSGHFVVNGTVVPAGAQYTITAAQLAQTTFVVGSAGVLDDLIVIANDGKLNSNAIDFHVTGNNPPVLTVPSATVSVVAGQSIRASTLFTATDADNDALTYYLYDNTTSASSGHFVVNGTTVPAGTTYPVSDALLQLTTFVAGSAGASDDLLVYVSDGKANSSLGEFHVNVDNPPVLTAPSLNVTAKPGQSFTASSLFSAVDADNDPISYYIYDNTPAANSGHFVLNGSALSAGTAYTITAAQLSQLSFVAGTGGTSDDLIVYSSDGKASSNTVEFHVNADNAPVLTAPSTKVAASAGQSFAAASLFSATDADGDPLTYYLYDNTPSASSGHFLVNGTVVPAGTTYPVTAAQLAQTTFVAGAVGSNDDLIVSVSDGKLFSSNVEFHVAVDTPPVLTPLFVNVKATPGQSIAASKLFSATDAENDPLTYYLYDNTATAGSGHFVVNGATVPAGTTYIVNAAQLAQTSFVAGPAGTFDNLVVLVNDGQAISNTIQFNVNVDTPPVLTAPSTIVSAIAGQSFTASSLFSGSDADNDALYYYVYDNTAAANSGHFVASGAVLSAGTTYTITAAQLAQLAFVAGAAGASDDLLIAAFDGTTTSSLVEIHVNADNPPVVTARSTITSATPGQSLTMANLFTASDADNDALTYTITDKSPAANTGQFMLGGKAFSAGIPFTLSAAQLAQTTFVAGAGGAADDVTVVASDGKTTSNVAEFYVVVDNPPVLTAPSANVSVLAGQTLTASSLFSATDGDNDPLTYVLIDNTASANSGHFVYNGAVFTAGQYYFLSATQVAQTTFVAGAAGVSDDVIVYVYDGKAYSNLVEFHVTADSAPTLAARSANVSAVAGQTFTAGNLFTATDAENDPLYYYIYDNTPAANSGHFVANGAVLSAGVSYTITSAQLSQLSFVAGAAGVSDELLVSVSDGKLYSSLIDFHVNADNPPVLTAAAANVSAVAGQSIAAASLFSATDLDGDALTYTLYDNTPAANSGHFVVNGLALTGSSVTVTAAQLATTTFVAGAAGVSDDLIMAASDGKAYSNLIEFHVNANTPPVLTAAAANVSANAGQSIAASTLFSATDADNDTLTYYLYDNTTAANSGHFLVGSTVVPAGASYTVTAAQLAQTAFIAGAAGISDDLVVAAFDGKAYSNLIEFHVNPVNHAPVLTAAAANVAVVAGQTIAASSLFSATDADNDALTYYLYDNTPAANSGHFVVNGAAVPAGTPYSISAAQLAQTTFVAGAAGVSDDLIVLASDGTANSGNVEFHVNADNPPVMTATSANVAATAGQSIAASTLFSATDADNDALTYYLYDNTPDANSGHFSFNGNVLSAGVSLVLTAAQLTQTTFVAGAANTSDDVVVSAFDGKAFSNLVEFHVNVADNAPVLTVPSANVAATAGQSIAASSLFSATDLDGDALTYYLYDNTPAAGSGHFSINGSVVPAATTTVVTAAQLATTTFVAGSAGANDDLIVIAYDGHAFSNHGEFHVFV